MTPRPDAFDRFWSGLSREEQEHLNAVARESILKLHRYPRNIEVAQELLAWQALEIEVMDAHAAWLERTRAKFEARGIEWTVDNLNGYSRLWEHE